MRTLPRPAAIARAPYCVATVTVTRPDLNGTPTDFLYACGAPGTRYSVTGSPLHPSVRTLCAEHGRVRVERDGWSPIVHA